MINRLELHISYSCVNHCVFCSERDQLEKFSGVFLAKKDIKNKLVEFFHRGFNHLTLTGGEPTFHPDIVEILQFAKNMGYSTYLTTNGGLFSSKYFSKNTLPYLDEICFSLHGHNAKIHNIQTKNKDSFSRMLMALKNVEESVENIFGILNIVATKFNIDNLCEIINFADKYKNIKLIFFSNFAPEGDGLRNFKMLAVPLSYFKKKIKNIASLAQKKSLIVRFFGIPLCVLGEYRDFSNDLHWSPRVTVEQWKANRRVFLKETVSYKPVRKRIKTSKCERCLRKGECGGVFEHYYREFGDKELQPLI